ncbi:MAG: site-specific DNA-methyltransferase [Verrucomicrobiaceae bacterium]
MPDTDTPIPASQNFTKLKAKLRELFELDKADLDFGIYRVLRQRHTEIAEFLDKHLETTVRSALSSHGDLQGIQIRHDLEKAEAAAQAAGIAAEQSPRVMELRSKLEKGADLEAIADEVYSHLLTFFSRYYQGGDFLGLHRSTVHGQERYMIPYNGEEVKLIWANMDQYYIKSSELLRDYNFKVSKNLGEIFKADPKDIFTVQFKLIEGDTEKDNRKADSKSTRAFSLDTETAFVETDEHTLTLHFRYSEHPSERNLQDKLNTDTEKTLADTLPPKWKALLFAADPSYQPKDKKDSRTIFQKHLRSYTAKHLFDYFIHKDLGGFLRRELDFYVKNEVMHLDDIEDSTAPKAEEYLSKIRAIRHCAVPVIRMVAQLEEFQKKLWLKKKFVVEARYCLTLDRVPESLYADICKCDAQWQEWEDLVALSELTPQRTPEFLKVHPHLTVDTKHFDGAFILKLLASIDDLDASLDGVCFHSENFQALQLMQERYREQVKCVYIDPPYNTTSSAILYKNTFKHSSWGTLMRDRLDLLRRTMSQDAAIFVSIDNHERTILEQAMDQVFGSDNHIEELVWSMNTNNSQAPNYSTNHEYVLVYAKDRQTAEGDKDMFREPKPGFDAVMELVTRLNPEFPPIPEIEEELRKLYEQHRIDFREEVEAQGLEWDDEKGNDPWKGLFNYSHAEYRDQNGVFVAENEAKAKAAVIRIWQEGDASMPATKQAASTRDPDHPNWRFYKPLHPVTKKPCAIPKSGWKFAYNDDQDSPDKRSFVSLDNDHRIAWGPDEKKVPRIKRMLHEVETNIGKSVFSDYSDGEKQTSALFGRSGVFLAPKHANFVSRFILHSSRKDSTVVDCFGGSGSTAHAVITVNRNERSCRKYVTAEMGAHFETIIIPRLKKVVYSTDWKEGKPQTRNTGISHAFKIVRLESYEDTLNNLRLTRSKQQDAALANATEAERDAYLLGYFLDVESAGSASLLDVTQFRDPFGYKLHIATSSAGETKETNVDLVETFNWLLGLKVKHIDHQKGFLTVTGEKRAGGRCLILWRSLSDDEKADNAALVKYLEKITVSPADTEYDFIYVNGPHTLNDPHNKVHLIEETFHRLMFDTTNFESLS